MANKTSAEKTTQSAETPSLSTTKYPSTMNCVECMDQLIDCFSLGGQIRNYYRYSAFEVCENQTNKLKFCLANGKDPVKIQEYYKQQQEFNKQFRGSSEDIWEER